MTNFHDGYLSQRAQLGRLSTTVQLVADNQAVNFEDGLGVLYIISNDTTATNRTFSIQAGSVTGQTLILQMNSAASTACDLQNTGNVKLSAAWQPATQYSTITLFWNGTYWVETARVTAA